ncbi:MAG: FAD:protein FMN transferase [Ruminococcaceae bacterium]|nr:FAD:protein FMN transferase [Oscillospiraceae bacterium]
MKRRLLLLIPLILLPLLVSCHENKHELSFFALDTVISVTTYGDDGKAAEAVTEEIRLCDTLFGRTEDSDISRINASEGKETAVDSRTAEMLSRSLALCRETGGCVDIGLGRVIDLWGFPQKQYRIPSADELTSALADSGYDKLTVQGNAVCTNSGVQLDIGAVAKGYISDRLRALLKEEGISSAIVSLGGNVTAIGSHPDGGDWTVAILDPTDRQSYACYLSVRDTNVITSGTYQRYFEQDGKKYCHVIDPSTGRPVDNGLASVTVICEDGLRGDALSTALLVMGLDEALAFHNEHPDFEAIFITESGEIVSTGIGYQKA